MLCREAIVDRHRPLPPLPMPTSNFHSSSSVRVPEFFFHLVPFVPSPPDWSNPSILSPPIAHSPSGSLLRGNTDTSAAEVEQVKLSCGVRSVDSQLTVDYYSSNCKVKGPLTEIQLNHQSHPHPHPHPQSQSTFKMNTNNTHHLSSIIPNSPCKPISEKTSPKELAQAVEAAAEREVIEETDAWNDISDDDVEQFTNRINRLPSTSDRSTLHPKNSSSTNHHPPTISNHNHNSIDQAPSIQSGSGRGIWDLPSNHTSASSSTQAYSNRPTNTILSPTNHLQSPQPSSSSTIPPSPFSTSPTLSPTSNLTHSNPDPKDHLTTLTDVKEALPELDPPIRKDFAELMRDPAHVLNQLKLAYEPPVEVIVPQPKRTGSIPLPWEAIIPAEILASGKGPGTLASTSSSTISPSDLVTHEPVPTTTASKPSTPSTPHPTSSSSQQRKEKKFLSCLTQASIEVTELRKLSWSGIPDRLRSIVWQILLGYLPAPAERRVSVLARKRQEYSDAVRLAFGKGLDQTIWHQIHIDVPRTNPGIALWQFPATQRSLERILYVWAIRHPASGYVQGINDLVTPFFQVFLSTYITVDPETFDVAWLAEEVLEAIEADSFWCLSKLLDGIQDNYIFAQPGIQRLVARMKELCKRVDAPLHQHLENEKVEFIQFAFRWINCLLMRELSTKKIIRMWDTYLAEGTTAFSEFHLYVCVAFLVKYSDQLQSMDFQSIIIFLQSLPTEDWSEKDTELVLSQAFMWYSLFQGATGHFIRK